MDTSIKIFIAGGTGLIGQYLVRHLYDSGYRPMVISRNKEKATQIFGNVALAVTWDDLSHDKNLFSGKYAIINLAGENISSFAWTSSFKSKIISSRISAVESLLKAIRQSQDSPELFIQGSAIGYYDNKKGEISTESSPKGSGFLADVVEKTENLIHSNAFLFRRYAIIRTGIVLSTAGGMLKRSLLPYKLFLGGPVGTGRQWRSWIHYFDHVRAIQYIIENSRSEGIYNLTAPEPVTEKKFSHTVAGILKRPDIFKKPAFLLKLMFGEMAEAILLNGEKAVPEKLLNENFRFIFPDIEKALTNLLCE